MTLGDIYTKHHRDGERKNFSIMEPERSQFFSQAVGTGRKVLDLGCRDGTLTAYFARGNTVLGVDVDANALDQARAKLGIETALLDLNGDWATLNGRKFDVIVAGEVLEHLYFPETIMAKAAKHLTAAGLFVGSVPNAFSLKHRLRYLLGRKQFTPLSDPTHINHFHVKELKAALLKHFTEVEIVGLGRYRRLARRQPGWWAFDLAFVAKGPRS